MRCSCRGVCRCHAGVDLCINRGVDQRIRVGCGYGLNGRAIEPEDVIGVEMIVACRCCPAVITQFDACDFDFNQRCYGFFLPSAEKTKELTCGRFKYQLFVSTSNERVLAQHGDFLIR